jgi:hypothetical protein
MPTFQPLPAIRWTWAAVVVRAMLDVAVEMASQPAEARAVLLGLLLVWREGDSELSNRFPIDVDDS